MMDLTQQVILGRSGFSVGRLGISSSYGATADTFEMAFEAGCNYFTYGTFIKGVSREMQKAVRNIVRKGQRDRLVIALFNYSHAYPLLEYYVKKDLRKLGIDHADLLILGYYNKKPGRRTLDKVCELQEKGLISKLAISSHKRTLFPELNRERFPDVIHLRYNAVNSGAEQDIFPYLDRNDRPGIVSFTATRWGALLNQKRMPPDEPPVTSVDAYRFVLTNPSVDVCMVGARNTQQMKEDLKVLELGPLSPEEMMRVRKIGDFIYGRKVVA